MNEREVVAQSADALQLLSADGRLVNLDSMSMMDLAVEIENRTGLTIPTTQLRQETFASVDAIATMIATLR